MTANDCEVSFGGGDENVLKLGGGNSCTTW